jgi:hypothetical protein
MFGVDSIDADGVAERNEQAGLFNRLDGSYPSDWQRIPFRKRMAANRFGSGDRHGDSTGGCGVASRDRLVRNVDHLGVTL